MLVLLISEQFLGMACSSSSQHVYYRVRGSPLNKENSFLDFLLCLFVEQSRKKGSSSLPLLSNLTLQIGLTVLITPAFEDSSQLVIYQIKGMTNHVRLYSMKIILKALITFSWLSPPYRERVCEAAAASCRAVC